VDTAITDRIYGLTLDIEMGQVLYFAGEYTRARVYGHETWKSLDDFDFHQIMTEGNISFMQFRTSVVYTPNDKDEGDEWKEDDGNPDATERLVIYTVNTKRLMSMRVVYEN